MVLAVIWGARALWAKVSGKPVSPWIMPMMRPGAAWTMYRAGGWRSTMADTQTEADSTAVDASTKRSGVLASVARDITDVQPREVRDM